MKILLSFVLISAAWAQPEMVSVSTTTPDIEGYQGQSFFSRFARKYLPTDVSHTQFVNSGRLDSLMRSGNIYLSLQDAIALALENNLDIEYHRYDRRQAETDQLRASAGQLLRFSGGNIRAGFSSASSGVLAGTSSLGGGTGTTGQNGILSGFSIQAAGSSIPNLEPLAFVSWQASHQTRPLTSSVSTGTSYLVSSAHSLSYGIQKSFVTGTKVTVDLSQQSLAQNAPANSYNPSLSGNAEISISQPLLQGFGVATNRRAITIAKNNLSVADLNFRMQVIATVKNVIDLYWDLVTLNDNVHAKQRSLDISQKLYDDNRKRLGIGAIAPIDIVQAEAGVQTAQLDLRQASAQVLQQELILKSALTRTGVDSVTVMDAHVIPTDSIRVPEAEAIRPIQDMVTEALSNRVELRVSQINLENNRINMKGVKNAMRPGLDVFVDLQNNSLAGTVNNLAIPNGPDGLPLFSRADPNPYFLGNWGTVFSQLLGRNFPTYSAGFNLNIPLSNSAARADMIKNQLDYRQAEIDAKQAENAVRLNVVNARISLEQARAAYETAVKARKLQEQTFAGTQRKYELGTATFTDVALLQRDVVTAQAAENNALNGYIKARNNLDQVLGQLLEVNNIDIQEAYKGKVSRQPSALPVLGSK
ncbi:MAG TPA: TolC family protein [Candidatus Acidoferrum sp.]|nr:TolC family protein [Candidatus Acidoferrum sp.]